MKKKILYISGAVNFGAPGRIVEQVGLLAQKYGYQVFVAHSTRNENPTLLPHFAVTTKIDEFMHALGAKLLDKHGLLSTHKTNALVERIKAFNPDIIHLHNIHGYFCNFKVLFEYLDTVEIPVVWTMHDCWPFTGRCFHFEGIGCDKWKTGCFDCNAESGYTVSPFFDRSQQLYELKKRLFPSVKNLTMVPVSEWQASFLKYSFLKNCHIEVIHNGVDLKKFMPVNGCRLREKYGIKEKFVILGVAAPWNKRKGLDDFLKLSRSMPSDKYSIVLVGLKKSQLKKIPQNVVGVTRTESQQELAEFYSMADVFCNLTYLDTFPTVNLEALACGTPVITYRTGGSPEAVDERTGIVIEQGNVDALIGAIHRMSKMPLSAKDCRKRAELLFDKDKCFEKYINLYNRLVK